MKDKTMSEVTADNQGRKDDTGKDPWHLFPWDAGHAIVRVLAFGAGKYAPRNWERGMDWSRPYAGLMRHMTAWWHGEKNDPETGYSHLWHAGCCIVFLIAYEIRGIGHDDRPVPHKSVTPRTDYLANGSPCVAHRPDGSGTVKVLPKVLPTPEEWRNWDRELREHEKVTAEVTNEAQHAGDKAVRTNSDGNGSGATAHSPRH